MDQSNPFDLFQANGPAYFGGPVYLGAVLDQTGQLTFFNSSSAKNTVFQAGNATADMTYVLPTAGPAGNNYIMASTTLGVLSWLNALGTYAPIGSAYVTIGADATLTAERSLTGTANQIVVTDNGAGSTVVLSTPQNIHTAATPTFASESLTATSNQLVLGTTRTATITAPTPATSSRTYTFPDQSADYSVVATQGAQTVSGTKTFDGQLIGKGTATNDSAAAGYIGEYLESTVTVDTSVGSSGTYFDLTSLALTAGDWDVTAFAQIYVNGATFTSMDLELGIGTASGTSTTGLNQGVNYGFYVSGTVLGTSGDFIMSVPSFRASISGTTTYYLKGFVAVYTLGTPKYRCRLSARRMR